MKKFFPLLMALFLSLPFSFALGAPALGAPAPSGENLSPSFDAMKTGKLIDGEDCVREIQYTDAQKKVLDQAYAKIYEDYEKLFKTYVEYGAMEKGQMEAHLRLLKRFIERIKQHHYRWCNDDDEWDEDDRWSEDSWRMDDRSEMKPEKEMEPEKGIHEKQEMEKDQSNKNMDGNNVEKGKWKKGQHKKGHDHWKKDDDDWEKDDDRWERDDDRGFDD